MYLNLNIYINLIGYITALVCIRFTELLPKKFQIAYHFELYEYYILKVVMIFNKWKQYIKK